MADLDAELLALAGGDSSDEEEVSQVKAPSKSPRSRNPSVSPVPHQDPGSSNPASKTEPKQPHLKKGSTKSHKEDLEEGEALSTPSSPSSLQSASMSESESDTSPGEVDDDRPMFPIENKYKDEKDKKYILSLPEIKREEILAERAAAHERHVQDKQLRRYIQDRERKEAKTSDKKKRKAGVADLEESHRKSTRQKTTLGGRRVGETSVAIEAYKRQREQKSIRDQQRRKDASNKVRHASAEVVSDADAEGESDVEWVDKASHRSSTPKDDQPPLITDFEHVRVGRSNFARVCCWPGFDETITGCFTRLSVGIDKATGQNVYRMALIKGFGEGKPYALEGPNGQMFHTNQYAKLAVGKAERLFPFLACSDSKFTDGEFERYQKTLLAEGLSVPTKEYLLSKLSAINALLNRTWTEEELQAKLVRQGALKNKFAMFERNTILQRREAAAVAGNESEVAQCDAELQALKGPKLAFGTSMQKPAQKSSKGPTQQERLAEHNRLVRKQNSETIRKAQLAERRAERRQQLAIERGEATINPFARVKTRAKTYYDINANDNHLTPRSGTANGLSDKSRSVTPASVTNGEGTPVKKASPERSVTPAVTEVVNGKPGLRRRAMDDEIVASIDLGIEIDI